MLEVILTLDELCRFRVLESLEEQNEDLLPVLNDWLPGGGGGDKNCMSAFAPEIFMGIFPSMDLRGHVLDDAVD